MSTHNYNYSREYDRRNYSQNRSDCFSNRSHDTDSRSGTHEGRNYRSTQRHDDRSRESVYRVSTFHFRSTDSSRNSKRNRDEEEELDKGTKRSRYENNAHPFDQSKSAPERSIPRDILDRKASDIHNIRPDSKQSFQTSTNKHSDYRSSYQPYLKTHPSRTASSSKKDLSDRRVLPYNKRISKAQSIYTAKQIIQEITQAGLKPDVYSYSALINVCKRNRDLDEALQALSDMKQNGITPDVVIFNSIIDGFVKKGNLDRAEALFDDMKQASITPDAFTYNTIINGRVKMGIVIKLKSSLLI